jgi:hypothetical protein
MLPTYYTSEYVAEMFAKPQKVCALCDSGFPVTTKKTQAVEVTAVNGKPVESSTYLMLPKSSTRKIQREFGVIDTDIVTTA